MNLISLPRLPCYFKSQKILCSTEILHRKCHLLHNFILSPNCILCGGAHFTPGIFQNVLTNGHMGLLYWVKQICLWFVKLWQAKHTSSLMAVGDTKELLCNEIWEFSVHAHWISIETSAQFDNWHPSAVQECSAHPKLQLLLRPVHKIIREKYVILWHHFTLFSY